MPRAIARIERYLIFMVLFVLQVGGERRLAVASFKGIDGRRGRGVTFYPGLFPGFGGLLLAGNPSRGL
jgi:hypothetical protein